MTAKLTRRACLWSLAIAGTTAGGIAVTGAGSVWADPPESRLRILGSSIAAVPSRSYRLQGATDEPVVVTAIATDPTGELLAVAGDDHQIRILRVSNFATVETLRGHRDVIRTLAFDPAGTKLVSAGNDGQLIVWDRGERFRRLQTMSGTPAIARVCFSPGGDEMAAVGFDHAVYLLGKSTRRPKINCKCGDLRAVTYREDGNIMAVAGRSGDLHLFDLGTGDGVGTFSLHRGRIHDVVFHRQSNVAVCVAEDGAVTVFDTQARKTLHRIDVTTGKLFTAAIINSQLVAVAGSDNDIRLINTDEGRVVRTLEGHRGSVSTLAASNDVLFSGSYDATIRRWAIDDMDPGRERIAELKNGAASRLEE